MLGFYYSLESNWHKIYTVWDGPITYRTLMCHFLGPVSMYIQPFPSLSQVPGWLFQSISLTPCMLVIGWDGGRYFYHDSFLAVMDAVDSIVIPFFTKEQSVLVSLVYFLFSIYYQLLTLLSHVYIASKLTD